MVDRQAFNIANWKLREQSGALILRPTVKHAFFRFLFGTLFFALLTFGLLGVDTELRNMRHGRRFTEENVASMRRGPADEAARLIAAGNPEAARSIQQSADTFINNFTRKRQAETAALEAAHRPWHHLLALLAGACIFFGIYLPLSPLWQRVRIVRDGNDLVVRRNLFPRTRRIPLAAINDQTIHPVAESVIHLGQWMTVGYYWRLKLQSGSKSIVMYIATTPSQVTTLPPHAVHFISALQRLAAFSG